MNKFLALTIVGFILIAGCVNQAAPSPTPGIETIAPTLSNGLAKMGDNVTVDYVLTLKNGTVVDTSLQAEAVKAGLPPRPSYEPFQLTIGAGQVIPGFEEAIIGMKVGQEKTVELPPAKAYGERKPEGIISVPKKTLAQNNITAEVGQGIALQTGQRGIITAVNETDATIDFNHPLAGQTLVFRIILKKIG